LPTTFDRHTPDFEEFGVCLFFGRRTPQYFGYLFWRLIAKKSYFCGMAKQILSIGRQSFRRLREDNCIYVDKTELLYNLCTQGSVYFLSRPRRFGKSLIVSTLAELFKGSRELFTGTWIDDKWDWTKTNPVIHISFASVDYEYLGLDEAIRQTLLEFYELYE
jgi:hypothetical protein